MYSASGGQQSFGPHEIKAFFLAAAPNEETFAAYGFSSLVEIWSYDTMTRIQAIDTDQNSINHLEFTQDGHSFITADPAGRLVEWTAEGKQRMIVQLDQPVTDFVLLSAGNQLVASTVTGGLWRISEEGYATAIGNNSSKITRMTAIPGAHKLCIGYANGDVMLLDTQTWQQTPLLRASDAIRDIEFSSDGNMIAVSSNAELVHIGTTERNEWSDSNTRWTTLGARARSVLLTPDGLLIAICTDGLIWIYDARNNRYMCVPTGTNSLTLATITSDAAAAVTFDTAGRIIWVDLKLARKLLSQPQQGDYRRPQP
jgi:WD40 repeat protein